MHTHTYTHISLTYTHSHGSMYLSLLPSSVSALASNYSNTVQFICRTVHNTWRGVLEFVCPQYKNQAHFKKLKCHFQLFIFYRLSFFPSSYMTHSSLLSFINKRKHIYIYSAFLINILWKSIHFSYEIPYFQSNIVLHGVYAKMFVQQNLLSQVYSKLIQFNIYTCISFSDSFPLGH